MKLGRILSIITKIILTNEFDKQKRKKYKINMSETKKKLIVVSVCLILGFVLGVWRYPILCGVAHAIESVAEAAK